MVGVPGGGVVLVKAGDRVDRGSVLVEAGAKSVTSPTSGTVVEKGLDSVTVSFSAYEVKMDEVVSGRVWSEGGLGLVNSLGDLNYSSKNRIIFSDNLNAALLMKASVMGVAAIVVVSDEDYFLPFSLKVSVPVGWISQDLYQKVLARFGIDKINLFLFNTQASRLLVVVE